MNKSTDANKSLFGLSPQEIASLIPHAKAFRGQQIFDWVQKGVESFDEMVNIPKNLKEVLTQAGWELFSSTIVEENIDDDGTAKLAIRLYDGKLLECVLLTDDKGRKTACVSSQVGCAMGCTFCLTGTMGLVRNLKTAEIVEQFHLLQNKYGTISHIVYMGMGEPLSNFKAVQASIEILHNPRGVNMGLRKITISTCGVADGIRKLATEGPHVKLAISLVASDNELRSSLMPINNAYPLEELKDAVIDYQEKTGRRVTFEYVLLAGVNDARRDANRLSDYIRKMNAIINIIPWNPGAELDFKPPTSEDVKRFTEYLTQNGVIVTRRYRRGRGVNGACGQLAIKNT